MSPYHPELLATPIPRYTSFPTAAEFGSEIGAPDLLSAIEGADGDISLFVHIPFCKEICWYCGCNTGRSNRGERLTGYLDALHREIALVGRPLPATARTSGNITDDTIMRYLDRHTHKDRLRYMTVE